MTCMLLSFLVAGTIVALLAFWFVYALHVLRQLSFVVRRAEEQMRLHQDSWEKVRGGAEEKAAARMLKMSTQMYEQARQSYHQALGKPVYRFPGFLMGVCAIPEKVHPKG